MREGDRPMPAAVLVVHDERDIRDLAVVALRAAFLDAVNYHFNRIQDLVRFKTLFNFADLVS